MKDFSLNCCIFNRQNLHKRVSESFSATTVRNLDTSVPTVIQKTTCRHCSGEHTFEDCSKTETDSICEKCNENHDADSIKCPKDRKQQQQIVYENRVIAPNGQQNYGLQKLHP